MVELNEERALRALARGDEQALETLIERYTPYVSTIVYNIIGQKMSATDVEEVTADVFIALWRAAASIRPGSLKAYLAALARNMAVKRLRSARIELELEEDLLAADEEGPERILESREAVRTVRTAVEELGEPDREIFLRHYYYGQQLVRIAEEMSMNLSTVKTRLRRGRGKLKDRLEKGGILHGSEDIGAYGSHIG